MFAVPLKIKTSQVFFVHIHEFVHDNILNDIGIWYSSLKVLIFFSYSLLVVLICLKITILEKSQIKIGRKVKVIYINFPILWIRLDIV